MNDSDPKKASQVKTGSKGPKQQKPGRPDVSSVALSQKKLRKDQRSLPLPSQSPSPSPSSSPSPLKSKLNQQDLPREAPSLKLWEAIVNFHEPPIKTSKALENSLHMGQNTHSTSPRIDLKPSQGGAEGGELGPITYSASSLSVFKLGSCHHNTDGQTQAAPTGGLRIKREAIETQANVRPFISRKMIRSDDS